MQAYPWLVQKNWALRWRRLLIHGGQSYRAILLSFAWLFQARPLHILVFFGGVWTISKLDPIEIVRDLRQGRTIINSPIPHVIVCMPSAPPDMVCNVKPLVVTVTSTEWGRLTDTSIQKLVCTQELADTSCGLPKQEHAGQPSAVLQCLCICPGSNWLLREGSIGLDISACT